MSGRNLSVRRMHQFNVTNSMLPIQCTNSMLPIQSLHPCRAYTLVADTEKKVVNLYALSVQRIITEQGRGWRTTERLWLASFLRKWPLGRHLSNVQKWDVHRGSGVNGPGRGIVQEDVTVGYGMLHTQQANQCGWHWGSEVEANGAGLGETKRGQIIGHGGGLISFCVWWKQKRASLGLKATFLKTHFYSISHSANSCYLAAKFCLTLSRPHGL